MATLKFDGTPQRGSHGMIPQKTWDFGSHLSPAKKKRKMTQRRTPINCALKSKQRFQDWNQESFIIETWIPIVNWSFFHWVPIDCLLFKEFLSLFKEFLVILPGTIGLLGISNVFFHKLIGDFISFRKSASVCLCHVWDQQMRVTVVTVIVSSIPFLQQSWNGRLDPSTIEPFSTSMTMGDRIERNA